VSTKIIIVNAFIVIVNTWPRPPSLASNSQAGSRHCPPIFIPRRIAQTPADRLAMRQIKDILGWFKHCGYVFSLN